MAEQSTSEWLCLRFMFHCDSMRLKQESGAIHFFACLFPNVLCANSAPPHPSQFFSSRDECRWVNHPPISFPPPSPPSSAVHCCVSSFIFFCLPLSLPYAPSSHINRPSFATGLCLWSLQLRWLSGCDLSFLGQINLWASLTEAPPPSFSALSQPNKLQERPEEKPVPATDLKIYVFWMSPFLHLTFLGLKYIHNVLL